MLKSLLQREEEVNRLIFDEELYLLTHVDWKKCDRKGYAGHYIHSMGFLNNYLYWLYLLVWNLKVKSNPLADRCIGANHILK